MLDVVEAELTGAPAQNLSELVQAVKGQGSTWALTDVYQRGLPHVSAGEGSEHLTHVVSRGAWIEAGSEAALNKEMVES